MEFILILVFSIGGKPAATAAEFNSRTACEGAKQLILVDWPPGSYSTVRAYCTPKG
jgi:hypothetical protein